MESKIKAIKAILQNTNIDVVIQNKINHLLKEMYEETELVKLEVLEQGEIILGLEAKVKEAQNVATEHMLLNVNLEKENRSQKEKMVSDSKIIEEQGNLIKEQAASISKLKEIVADIVNKI